MTQEQLAEIKLPWRVLPGRLSVSRTFGDIMAKLPSLGGKPGVISAEPDIFSFDLLPEIDFVLLCCDGVYDRLEVQDVTRIV